MFRPIRYLVLLLAVPAVLAAPAGSPPAQRPWPRAEQRPWKQDSMGERFQHREARIREALERGDLTPAEADMLRKRLDARRERMEQRQRERQEQQRDNGRTEPPAPPAASPNT